MHRPTTDHWQAAKRILRYLARIITHGIFLHVNSPISLHAFLDAYWAGDTDDYVSKNAYVIYIGCNIVSWSSKKNNEEVLAHQRTLNIVQLKITHLKYVGYAHCLQNSVFNSLRSQ